MSTEGQLQIALANLQSNTTILVAPGTYQLTSTLHIRGTVSNVALRGETENRDDVQIVGPGMTNAGYGAAPNGIWTGDGVQGVLIANLTVRDFYFHPIILNPGTAEPRIYNVRVMDGGEQLVKSNPDSTGKGIDRGVVEYSVFEFTTTSRDYYTNGIDVHGGSGWIIRNNLFRNIRAPFGQLAGPTILMWRHSSNTLVEGNTFVNCQREIALGLENATPNDHSGGIIRNNFIYRDATLTNGDAAINIDDSPNSQVLNNTILISGTYPNAIEYRFPDTTGVVVMNNLTDAVIRARDGAVAMVSNNYTSAIPSFFVAPSLGDLHLTAAAMPAIDKGVPGVDVALDWDGESRPSGAAPDLGADEFLATANQAPTVWLSAPAMGSSYVAPATISVTAEAADADGTIAAVAFYSGDTLIDTVTTSPYSTTLSALTAGTYSFKAVAQDDAGARATSAAMSITVTNPVTDPPPQAPPSTAVIAMDAFVRGGSSAGVNFGTASQLEVKRDKATGNTREAYLNFDLTNLSTVSRARLRVFARTTAAKAKIYLRVHSGTDTPWSESMLTWNNKPPSGNVQSTVGISSTTASWYDLDVTSLVQSAKAAGKSSVTVVLKSATQTTTPMLAISSREGLNPPQLVVLP